MKRFIYFMIVVFMFLCGCKKDSVSYENGDLKKAEILIKMNFCLTPNFELPWLSCLPEGSGQATGGGGWWSGQATYFGKINNEKSYCETTFCFINEFGQWIQESVGIITVSNGDYCNFIAHTITTFPEVTFTGEIIINDGSGRFKGAKGTILIDGSTDTSTGISCWTGVGKILFE
ncbi:MAG: hypothetical protein ACOZDD_05800 [Bacteroidota bacterium]